MSHLFKITAPTIKPGRIRGARVVAAAAASALCLFTVACSPGSSGAGSGGGNANVDEAKKIVESYRAVPTFTHPGPEVDVAALAGKKIFNIPISSEIPFDEAIGKSMQQIAEQTGIEFTTFANSGEPSEWVRGIDIAVAQKPDLLMLQGAPDPAVLQPQLAKAKAEGIPVLMTHQYPNGVPTPAGVTAQVTGAQIDAARAEMAYAIAEAGADANILVITSNEVPVSKYLLESLEKTKKELCDSCKMTTVNVPISDWATKIQTQVQSSMTADPKLTWIIPLFDSMSQFVTAGITSTGRDNVRIATFNGTPSVMKMIQDGDIVAMDAGESPDWLAHANMDQAFRLMSGMEPVEQNTPMRLFDDENVDDAGTPPELGKGYGEEYLVGYQELWGLG